MRGIEEHWDGEFFASLSVGGTAGVAVFVRENVCEAISLVYQDDDGRVLVLELEPREKSVFTEAGGEGGAETISDL